MDSLQPTWRPRLHVYSHWHRAAPPDLIVRPSKTWRRMSALGQKRTSEHLKSMSALPPKSGHGLTRSWYLLCAKSGHYALQRTSLFDHLVGAAEHGLRNSEAERAWHSCVSIYAL